jgi:CBS domain-containing protein
MTQAPDTVGEIMTSGVVTVGPGQPVREAVTAMIEHDIGCVIVSEGDRALGDPAASCVDDGRLVGIVTERDPLRWVGEVASE